MDDGDGNGNGNGNGNGDGDGDSDSDSDSDSNGLRLTGRLFCIDCVSFSCPSCLFLTQAK
jgi:hypothetical protein